MLSGLLKKGKAIQVSINIMNAFEEMRKFLTIYGQLFQRLKCRMQTTSKKSVCSL